MSKKVKFSKTDAKMKQMIGRKKKISPKRIDTYDLVFREIHELTGLTPTQIIEIAKKEEKPFITEDGLVDIIDINDRRITQIQYEYDAELRNSPKNGRTPSEKTLRLKGSTYRSFLKEFDILLPKPIEYDIPKKQVRDDEIPSWEDVQKAMTLAKSPRDKAAIAFAATTGIRVSDIVGFKIKDLIKACSIYFSPSEEHTIENLLDKNPDNIMPCWEFTPKKTKKHENLAITFNTAETTNYIFDYLKYRIHLDKENDGDGKLMDDDPLFASQRGNFLHENRLEYQIRLINDRMGGEKDRNGLYSKFRLHNLRALFKTTCRRAFKEVQIDSTKNFDGDIVDLFTGHSSEGLRHVYEAVPRDTPEKTEEVVNGVKQVVGYLFTSGNVKNLLPMITGIAGGGKSVFANILIAIFGKDKIADLKLQEIEKNTHATSSLVNKHLNIIQDSDDSAINNNSLIKQITGNDPLQVNPKHMDPFVVPKEEVPKSVLICNSLPYFKKLEPALLERFLIIEFNVKFRGTDKEKPNLLKDILGNPEEIEWFIYESIQAYKEMLEKDEDFILRKDGEETRKLVDKHQNPVNYVLNNLIIDHNPNIIKDIADKKEEEKEEEEEKPIVKNADQLVYTQDLNAVIIEFAKEKGIELTLNRKGNISSKFLIGTIRYEFDLEWDYATQTANGKRYYPDLITNDTYWITLHKISPKEVPEEIKKELQLEEQDQEEDSEEGENTA